VTVTEADLSRMLADAGTRLGFVVDTGRSVGGGRIDVLWRWRAGVPLPSLDEDVPVVGFKIESGRPTAEHLNGDLLDFQDAGVALGVIVITDGPAPAVARRAGPRVLVWTEAEARAFAEGNATARPDTPPPAVPPRHPAHRGRYKPLWEWLQQQERRTITLTFHDLERLLGFPLPEAVRERAVEWYRGDRSSVARAITDAGWKAVRVDVNAEIVMLVPERD